MPSLPVPTVGPLMRRKDFRRVRSSGEPAWKWAALAEGGGRNSEGSDRQEAGEASGSALAVRAPRDAALGTPAWECARGARSRSCGEPRVPGTRPWARRDPPGPGRGPRTSRAGPAAHRPSGRRPGSVGYRRGPTSGGWSADLGLERPEPDQPARPQSRTLTGAMSTLAARERGADDASGVAGRGQEPTDDEDVRLLFTTTPWCRTTPRTTVGGWGSALDVERDLDAGASPDRPGPGRTCSE